jgi:hypothetical protein
MALLLPAKCDAGAAPVKTINHINALRKIEPGGAAPAGPAKYAGSSRQ